MAVYAIGDVHGCYDELQKLLNKIHFDPEVDELWSVGDMVNRGPKSLQVLQYFYALGDAGKCVLGNHELSLLFRSGESQHREHRCFSPLLKSDAAEMLLHWLRHRPLFHQNSELGWCMVHAAIHPCWTFEQAALYAKWLEAILQSDDWWCFLARFWTTSVATQEPTEKGSDAHLFFCLDVFTRTRFCSSQYEFYWKNSRDFSNKKTWFSLRQKASMRIAFGHWSEMGLIDDQAYVLGLDSGCIWGKKLSVARLDQVPIHITQVRGLR